MEQTTVATEQPSLVGPMMLAFAALNGLDTGMTISNIAAGATEVNPITSYMLQMGTAHFVIFKLVTMPVACLLVWRNRWHPWALRISVAMLMVYSFIIGMHTATAVCLDAL